MPNRQICQYEPSNADRQVKRIRLIRRKTRVVRKPDEKKSDEDESFISQILLIKLKPKEEASEKEIAALHGCETHFLPYIAYSYSCNGTEGQMDKFPPSLFYPDFTCPWRTDHGRAECGTFSVILTDEKCNRSFAYCYKFRMDDEVIQSKASVSEYEDDLCDPTYFVGNCVLVLVSHYPDEKLLMSYASDAVQSLKRKRNTLEEVCQGLMRLEVSSFEKKVDEGHLRPREKEIKAFTVAPLSISIQRLGIETTVYIFLSLLAERRILITGENVKIVSDTVQMFARLLAPLEWPHTLIPVIPDTLIELCLNPAPYLCGTMRHNLHKINGLFKITEKNEDIIIVDAERGIYKPMLELNTKDKEKRMQTLIDDGRKMGFSKRMIHDLVKFLESVFPCRDPEKATYNIQNRIMVWYAKTFGHYRRWGCPNDFLTSTNKHIFAKVHPVLETREFLHWFCESGIFQNFVYGSLGKKYHDPIYLRFEKKLKEHAPPLKAKGTKNFTRRFVYNFWHR